MSWDAALVGSALALSVAVGLVLIPGYLINRALGLDSALSWLSAPAPSLLVLVGAGGAVRLIGVRFDVGPGLIALLLITVVLAVLARLAAGAGSLRSTAPAFGMRWFGGAWPLVVMGGSLGITAAILKRVVGSWETWLQLPDSIFHVGATTWMARHGSAWVGDVPRYSGPTHGPFPYPGVWHAVTAVVASWTHQPPVVVSTLCLAVMGGVVWSASMIVLLRQTVGRGWVPVAVGALSILLVVPTPMMALGGLWPYVTGLALIPVVVAMIHRLCVAESPAQALSRRQAAVLLVAALGAATVCHPSAFFSGCLVSLPLLATRAARSTRRGRWLLVLGLVVLTLWALRPSAMVRIGQSEPSASLATTGLRILGVISPLPILALTGWTLLVLALVLGVPRRDRAWVAWGLAVPTVLASVVFLLPVGVSAAFTWPWWNDSVRIAALVDIPALVLVAALLQAVLNRPSRRSLRVAVDTVVAALLAASVPVNVAALRAAYHPTVLLPPWITADGRRQVATLALEIPPGAVVLANPYAGGTHLYLTRDVSLLLPTEWTVTVSPQARLLAAEVDQMRSSPRVCRAAHDAHLAYVLTGGVMSIWGAGKEGDYRGISTVSQEGGFDLVARSGPYALWTPPRC